MSGLNPEYINSLTDRINSVVDCSELQDVSDEVSRFIADQIAACNAELDKLRKLLVVPTDLPSVLEWIKLMVDIFSGGVAKYQILIATYMQQLAALVTAVTNKSLTLSCSNITPPHV